MIAANLFVIALRRRGQDQARQHSAQSAPRRSAKQQPVPDFSSRSAELVKPPNKAPRRKSSPLSPLFKLPPELIQHIAAQLPPSSAAAFALSSHGLSQIVGTRFWRKCNELSWEQEKHALLDLISKDLVDYIHCHRCIKLHRAEFTPNARKCTVSDIRAGAWPVFFSQFTFVHLQMAMKLHRMGKDPKSHLEFLTRTNVKLHSTTGHRPYISHEPRIIDDEVLFRSQYAILIPRTDLQDASTMKRLVPDGLGYFAICGHLTLGGTSLIDLFTSLWRYVAAAPYVDCARINLFECEACGAESQMHSKSYGEEGVIFFVTKWANLGAAMSPYDDKWTAHLDDRYSHKIRPAIGHVIARFEHLWFAPFTPRLSQSLNAALFQSETPAS